MTSHGQYYARCSVGQEGFCLSGYTGSSETFFGHLIIPADEKGWLKFLRAVPAVRKSFKKDGLVDITKVVTDPNCTLTPR